MLRVEQLREKHSSLGSRFRAHHFNWGNPGDQPEGIWKVISGGRSGGRTKSMEVGAEVIGHGHIAPVLLAENIIPGHNISTHTKDGRMSWVKLDVIRGKDSGMIHQEGENEVGFEFIGKIIVLEIR